MLRHPARHLLRAFSAAAAASMLPLTPAHASFLSGEALDTAANVLSWVVLVVVPVVGIVVFWLIHILPEKIAEQRRHPQAKAIQTLCLLSLLFGGLLWPLAWLWAYTKPVLHKLAYGTDVADGHDGEPALETEMVEARDDIGQLRERLAALESRLGQEARG
jgi:CBS domain containing-hemolysin-like protein